MAELADRIAGSNSEYRSDSDDTPQGRVYGYTSKARPERDSNKPSARFNYPFSVRRDGREAEGAPLLREYGVNSSIEGSNPSLSAIQNTELDEYIQRI